MGATPRVIDFTDVPEGGARFNKKRQPEGDYPGLVMRVEDSPTKQGNEPQWLFTIKAGTGTYPYYCKLDAKSYWKVRNLLAAAGLKVPSKRVNVDPNKVVGKQIGVTLQDAEWNDRLQSEIGSIMPLSEISPNGVAETVDDDEEEEEEETPSPTRATPTVDDDELEELEVEEL